MSATASSAVSATATDSSLSSMMSEMQSAEQKATALREAFNAERTKRIAGLHAELGFENSEALILAIRAANGKGRKARKAGGTRKARTEVTSDIKKAIIADAKEGKLTGLEIANKHKVSIGTVQNIKKAANLVG